MKRVTGIGGIFFKARDPVALRAWYREHLGIDVQSWGGAAFTWADDSGQPVKGTTVWNIGEQDNDYYAPSTSSFMVNYRVADLTALLAAYDCTTLGLMVVRQVPDAVAWGAVDVDDGMRIRNILGDGRHIVAQHWGEVSVDHGGVPAGHQLHQRAHLAGQGDLLEAGAFGGLPQGAFMPRVQVAVHAHHGERGDALGYAGVPER